MPTLIHERVRQAQLGKNPFVVARVESGWVVIGDVQPTRGYCLLLPDPVVLDLNTLPESDRMIYLRDMARVGDALMRTTECYRINYEILGNVERALHAHIIPRYETEPDAQRRAPPFVAYDWGASPKFDFAVDAELFSRVRKALAESLT